MTAIPSDTRLRNVFVFYRIAERNKNNIAIIILKNILSRVMRFDRIVQVFAQRGRYRCLKLNNNFQRKIIQLCCVIKKRELVRRIIRVY